MGEEDKGFEVVDKRKVTMDEDGEVTTHAEVEAAESQEAAEADLSEEEIAKEMAGLPPVDVYSLLRYFISLLGAQTWQWLGLVKSPVTGAVEKDLDQAKVAIDTIAALAAQLEQKASPGEQAELKALMSDLRINFVQQSGRQ